MGGGIVADTGAPPAPVFQQIVIQQHQQRVGVEVIAVLVNDAQPVRVAVGGNAQVAPVIHHIGRQHPQRLRAGRGHSSAKKGVMLLVDHVHVAPAGEQNRPQAAEADAVHGIDGHPQPGAPDRLGVDHLKNAVHILVKGIPLLDDSRRQRVGIGNAPDILRPQPGDFLFNFSGDGHIRVPSAGGENLDAVVNRRVVAGGDGQSVGKSHLLDGKHNQRRGNGAVNHKGPESAARQHLRRPEHGLLGQKAPVVAQADHSAAVAFLLHQRAQPRRDQADVFLGEFIGDNGPPPAGTKFDHRFSSPDRIRFPPIRT